MIGAIIQARISSTRLPKKVLLKIEGKTVLEHVILRLKRVNNLDKIVLATTDKKEDNTLEKIAKNLKISVFRGSEDDVLDRIYQAARLFKINSVVRITADCPLLDPKIVEKVIDFYLKDKYDYVSNVHPSTLPDGLDVEVFDFKALEKNWLEAKSPQEREHVYPYIFKIPGMFKIGNFISKKDFSSFRLTLDEKSDFILIKEIYKELYFKNSSFGLKEVLKLFEEKPELIEINQQIIPHSVSRWEKGQNKL